MSPSYAEDLDLQLILTENDRSGPGHRDKELLLANGLCCFMIGPLLRSSNSKYLEHLSIFYFQKREHKMLQGSPANEVEQSASMATLDRPQVNCPLRH